MYFVIKSFKLKVEQNYDKKKQITLKLDFFFVLGYAICRKKKVMTMQSVVTNYAICRKNMLYFTEKQLVATTYKETTIFP